MSTLNDQSKNAVFLSLDMGTQSIRALAINLDGQVLGIGKEELTPYVAYQPGWAEQSLDYYWAKLGAACHQLWQTHPYLRSQVVAVSVTTQRGTVVLSDADGNAVRPALLWLDQRRATPKYDLPVAWRSLFKVLGLPSVIQEFEARIAANWVRQNEPTVWAKTKKYQLLSGYVTYRLTGKHTDSIGCQVGYIPFDYQKLDWAAPHNWRWRLSTIEPSMLPELKQPGEVLGNLTPNAQQHLGLNASVPLIAAAADKACEVLGAGAIQPQRLCMSFGTTATVNATLNEYKELNRFIPPFPAAIPRAYNTEFMIYRGFWMVSWFKEQFGQWEAHQAFQTGQTPEAIFEAMAREVPPGSMGLVLQPYWSPGRKDPGPEAKGAILGFGDVHHKGHIYRALLEGLAYGMRQGKELIERRSGVKAETVSISGGGSQSELALQITADVLGMPVERPHTHETSGVGAAINAAVGLGYYADYDAAVRAMTSIGKVIEPNLENHRLYTELYQQVYRPMYRRLSPLYKAIRRITGYPSRPIA